MSEFSRETLLNIIETDHVQCGDASVLARMALAAMDSEPVAIIDQANLDYLLSGADADVWPPEREEMGDVLLYRHPQPAQVVPDDVLDALQKVARIRLDMNDFDGDRRGIADCLCDAEEALIEVVNRRAAMLAAAPHDTPALNSVQSVVTVPGKWIPVSERMPIEFEAVIAFDGDQVYGEAMHSSDDGFTIDGYDPCDRVQLQNVTHWMPLPSAPQEVKGE
ncbi:DUF551 domain-containing protein [Klebsiella pneumoniae]